jgi:hypothetical protein
MVEIQTFLVSHLTLRGSPHEPGLSQPIGPSMTQCAIEALSEIMLEMTEGGEGGGIFTKLYYPWTESSSPIRMLCSRTRILRTVRPLRKRFAFSGLLMINLAKESYGRFVWR